MGVVKDYWVEDRPGIQMAHVAVAGIKEHIGCDEKFCKCFIDICGHRRTDTFGGFASICKILDSEMFMLRDYFRPQFLIPAAEVPKLSIADQHHLFQPTLITWTRVNPSHPRFRYQVVYGEKGVSIFEVTSSVDVFTHIGQAADGTCSIW